MISEKQIDPAGQKFIGTGGFYDQDMCDRSFPERKQL